MPNVELRLFNPFACRGSDPLLHFSEYPGDGTRLRTVCTACEGDCVGSQAGVHRFDESRSALVAPQCRDRLIIDNPELANQTAAHFADIAQPANNYTLRLSEAAEAGHRHLIWHTLENGKPVDYQHEPG